MPVALMGQIHEQSGSRTIGAARMNHGKEIDLDLAWISEPAKRCRCCPSLLLSPRGGNS